MKWNHECSNVVANILPASPPQRVGMGSKGQNSTFSEYDHVTYQVKENYTCNSMVANVMPVDPPDPGAGDKRSKLNFYR